MPSLQLHQLRVAAVARLIGNSFKKPVDAERIILACLFHDMGNIIKSDLRYFADFCKPEGVEYWEKVKSEFVAKYSTDHHRANIAIAKEIGLPSPVINLIDSIGFSQLEDVVADSSEERKIMQYADIRVGPHGILSLRERMKEGRERYLETRNARNYYESEDEFEHFLQVAEGLEKQVMSQTSLAANDITDAAIQNSVAELRNYVVD